MLLQRCGEVPSWFKRPLNGDCRDLANLNALQMMLTALCASAEKLGAAVPLLGPGTVERYRSSTGAAGAGTRRYGIRCLGCLGPEVWLKPRLFHGPHATGLSRTSGPFN